MMIRPSKIILSIVLMRVLGDSNFSRTAKGVIPTAFVCRCGKAGPRPRNIDQSTQNTINANPTHPPYLQILLLEVAQQQQQPNIHFLPSISTASCPPPPLPLTDNPYILLGFLDPYAPRKNSNEEPAPFPNENEIKRVYHRLVRFYHPDSPPASYATMVSSKSREESEADLEKLNEAYHKLISCGGKYDASNSDKENVLVHCQPARRSRRKNTPPPSNCTAVWRVKDIPDFLLRNANNEKKCEALAVIPGVTDNNDVGEEEKKWDPSQMLDDILRFEKNDWSNGHVIEDDSDMLLIQDYIRRRSKKDVILEQQDTFLHLGDMFL